MTDIRVTERSGDESRLVRAALDDGAETIAVLGGDGTWGKCAATLAESGARSRMAFLCAGTGNDFALNVAAPSYDLDAMAKLVATGGVDWFVDMGRVESEGRADWFLNVAGFGFDVAVLEQTSRGGALSGRAVYVAAALRELRRYPGLDVSLDPETAARRAMMVVISNGRRFGGAFNIAPRALVDDGLLDLVAVGDVRGLARVALFTRVLRGTHVTHPSVAMGQADAFALRFATPPAYEVDGEVRHASSPDVRVSCMRNAVSVLAASVPSPRRAAS